MEQGFLDTYNDELFRFGEAIGKEIQQRAASAEGLQQARVFQLFRISILDCILLEKFFARPQ